MARPKKIRTPEDTDAVAAAAIDHAALEAAGDAATALGTQIATVDRTYGVDMPYHLDLYITAIRQHATESAARLIDIGRMLILIREHESREVFHHTLERCGLSPRFAYRAIQTARKMKDRKAIQQLGVSKALELMSEDDEALAELDQGGSIAGLTLDEIDSMSVREVRETLRKERAERAEDKAADEEIIRNKDERINKLSRRSTRSSQREAAATLLADMDLAAVEIASQVKHLLETATAIDQLYADAGTTVDDEVQERVDINLNTVADRLRPVLDVIGE